MKRGRRGRRRNRPLPGKVLWGILLAGDGFPLDPYEAAFAAVRAFCDACTVSEFELCPDPSAVLADEVHIVITPRSMPSIVWEPHFGQVTRLVGWTSPGLSVFQPQDLHVSLISITVGQVRENAFIKDWKFRRDGQVDVVTGCVGGAPGNAGLFL